MQYTDISNLCSEIFSVSRKLSKCFIGSMIKSIIQEFLVRIHQRIQFFRYCKNSMKVWSVQYILLLLINPNINIHSLAHGTVSVFAGIIMNVCIMAGITLTYMCSHFCSTASLNTFDSKILPIRKVLAFCILRKESFKDILNSDIIHFSFSYLSFSW